MIDAPDFINNRLATESTMRCTLYEMRGYLSHLKSMGLNHVAMSDVIHIADLVEVALGLNPIIVEMDHD